MSRRHMLLGGCCGLALLLACIATRRPIAPLGLGATGASEPATRLRRLDAAIAAATEYLLAKQSADGAWRSDVYPPFKAGDALTPLVLMALVEADDSTTSQAAIGRGTRYLAAMAGQDGQIHPLPAGMTYPVYTASAAVIALSRESSKSAFVRDAWLKFLVRRQLCEPLGWQPDDPFYGGWGYASGPPHKPAPGEPLAPLAEPNLSATVFAMTALRAAGFLADAPEIRKALRFVRRCQNTAQDTTQSDPNFDDGGFVFMLGDPVRNKAGVVGVDRSRRTRFASYGSATVDGLRCLLLGGLAPDDHSVSAAAAWLAQHFSATEHPGAYNPQREGARQSLFFYYSHSLSELLASPGRCLPAALESKRPAWANALADSLIERQQRDGSWINPSVDVREDDPLLATALALRSLALCRGVIAQSSQSLSSD